MSPAQRARRLSALQGQLPDAEQEEDDLDDETRDLLVDEYTAALELDQLRREIVALKEPVLSLNASPHETNRRMIPRSQL